MRRSVLLATTLGLLLAAPVVVRGDDRPDHDFANDVDGALWAIDVQKLEWRKLGHIEVPAAGPLPGGQQVASPLDRPVLIDLASTPDGYLWAISETALYLVNITDPTKSVRVGEHHLDAPYGLGLGLGGQLLATTRDGQVVSIDPRTAKATPLGSLGGGLRASGDVAYIPPAREGEPERLVATVKDASRTELLAEVDPKTGAGRVIGKLRLADGTPVPDVFGLIVRKGVLHGLTRDGGVFVIDPATAVCRRTAKADVLWWGATEYLRM